MFSIKTMELAFDQELASSFHPLTARLDEEFIQHRHKIYDRRE